MAGRARGSITATLGILWIVVVLSILEVSLSFDNAVVNATVLRDMDPVWQQRFLTIGILIAVFGMRIVFPIAIVAIAARVGPLEAVSLSLNNPAEYERIVSEAHIGIAGFGGAFLAMVGLTFFFDNDKEVHWIAAIEKAINKILECPRSRDRAGARASSTGFPPCSFQPTRSPSSPPQFSAW
jgi:hypothetical protein